jgi:hypothetical protein
VRNFNHSTAIAAVAISKRPNGRLQVLRGAAVSTARHDIDAGFGNGAVSREEIARRFLASHVHFHGRADNFTFEFNEHSGVLTVQGVVPTYYLKQLVQNVLKKLHGVTRVDNQIQVG